jgi:hypothetical protein
MFESEYPTSLYASFILRGKDLDPQEVSTLLDINPSRSFKRGERRTETKVWPHGFWKLESKDHIQSENLASHIEWLVNQLEPMASRLTTLVKERSLDAVISCFWIAETGHAGLGLSASLINRIATLGLRLEVDIYCSDKS